MFPIDRFFVFLKIYLWETCFLCFKQRKKHLSCFKKINFEKNKKNYLWETWKKHIMCFLDFSFRNTFWVSMGKTLWKSQNVSLNGFFWGKHHPAPAVTLDEASLFESGKAFCNLEVRCCWGVSNLPHAWVVAVETSYESPGKVEDWPGQCVWRFSIRSNLYLP